MKRIEKDQIWKRNENGTMELISETEVEREVEIEEPTNTILQTQIFELTTQLVTLGVI